MYNKQVFWVGEPFVVLLMSQCREKEEEAPSHTPTYLCEDIHRHIAQLLSHKYLTLKQILTCNQNQVCILKQPCEVIPSITHLEMSLKSISEYFNKISHLNLTCAVVDQTIFCLVRLKLPSATITIRGRTWPSKGLQDVQCVM